MSETFNDRTFTAERIELCGKAFARCTFIDCDIVYDASGTVTLEDCRFSNPKMVFKGRARQTIQFLRALAESHDDGSMRERMLEALGLATIARANVLPA